jgi:hypothetical protein
VSMEEDRGTVIMQPCIVINSGLRVFVNRAAFEMGRLESVLGCHDDDDVGTTSLYAFTERTTSSS